MPPTGIVICVTIASMVLLGGGALWASSPKLFVRVWRRIAIGDYYVKSAEWEKAVTGPSARPAGFLMFCFGLGGFYLLLRLIHVIK